MQFLVEASRKLHNATIYASQPARTTLDAGSLSSEADILYKKTEVAMSSPATAVKVATRAVRWLESRHDTIIIRVVSYTDSVFLKKKTENWCRLL